MGHLDPAQSVEMPESGALSSSKPNHQQVTGFLKDLFLICTSGDRLPYIVSQATMELFYQEHQ
eukprot:maker-scaffold55_size446313-snap-gene-3.27 protein:Tk00244 transcript:maker-scaffold55_size446313-snap-gene-3.27-mRNA-1 annotation:"hypothetical protein PGUG_04456"